VLDSGRALFYQLLNLITMKISKIKSFVFGLPFLGAMGFGSGNVEAQSTVEPGGGCFQRMVRCGGQMTVYHCDGQRTSETCRTYYLDCNFC